MGAGGELAPFARIDVDRIEYHWRAAEDRIECRRRHSGAVRENDIGLLTGAARDRLRQGRRM
jgi:hypothetical protein